MTVCEKNIRLYLPGTSPKTISKDGKTKNTQYEIIITAAIFVVKAGNPSKGLRDSTTGSGSALVLAIFLFLFSDFYGLK